MVPKEQILKIMGEKVGHPASIRELFQIFRIPREERQGFTRQIKALTTDGDLIKTRGNRFGLPDKMDLIVGRLETHPNGFGFVIPERPAAGKTGDIYIAAPNLKEGLHGDRVVARIEGYKDGNRAEGRIVRILTRAQQQLVGRFEQDKLGLAFVVPFDRRVLMDVHIPSDQTGGATPGHMVTVELTRWPTATRNPVGRVSDVLGPLDASGVDTEIILRKYAIPDEHSSEAIEEARRLGTTVRKQDSRHRTDFRQFLTVTIDGEHARDFDDAITIERLPNGNYWLGVHIADVSHYVTEGSALDTEAYERGTSVYFPERAVHMFPSELATGLCSLNPHVDRLVQSCLMEVDRHGTVVRYELHDGVINSDERMTYTAVNAILAEDDPATKKHYKRLIPMFVLMRELFDILHRRRRQRGSIDFDLKEPEVILDDQGQVEAIIATERNVAHRLIEEFMLLANETVAQHLFERGTPSLYRVHEPPDPLKVQLFEEFLSNFRYSLAAPLHALRPAHFQRLLERIKGKAEERPIAFLMLRTMQKARYAPENLGHFGLATPTYTHFTSPIRRYPDLVVHRMLRLSQTTEVSAEGREELEEEMPEMAHHASEMERRADEAERELVQWKKVRFMTDKVGDEFEGYVTGVTPFGLFVELVEHFVEGLVHVSSMADDYYHFQDRAHSLRGENTQKVYRLGDRVQVQVIKVDLENRRIDLGLVEILEAVRATEAARHSGAGRIGRKRDSTRAGRSRWPETTARATRSPQKVRRQQGRGRSRRRR